MWIRRHSNGDWLIQVELYTEVSREWFSGQLMKALVVRWLVRSARRRTNLLS